MILTELQVIDLIYRFFSIDIDPQLLTIFERVAISIGGNILYIIFWFTIFSIVFRILLRVKHLF